MPANKIATGILFSQLSIYSISKSSRSSTLLRQGHVDMLTVDDVVLKLTSQFHSGTHTVEILPSPSPSLLCVERVNEWPCVCYSHRCCVCAIVGPPLDRGCRG